MSSKSNVKKRKQHDSSEASSSDSEFTERASSNRAHVVMKCWQTNQDSQCAMIQNRNKAQNIN